MSRILPDIAVEQLDGVLPSEHGSSVYDEASTYD